MAVPKKTILKYCVGCRREININNFNTSKNPNHGGHLPYCKDCCNEIFNENMKKMKSLEGAMFMTCAEMGVPMIHEIYDKFTLDYENRNLKYTFGGYYTKLNTQKIREWSGFWETDVDYKDIAGVSRKEQSIRDEMKDLRLLWGKDCTVEQLQFLEFQYAKYVGDEFVTDYQESLYRDLARAELKIYENDDIDNALKRKNAVGKLLGLDNIKANKQETIVEKMLEKRIAVQEQEEPAYYYRDLEKYADFMGIGKYWENHILRPVKNLLLGQKEYKIIKDEE